MRYQNEFLDYFKFKEINKLREYYEKHKEHIDIHWNNEECFRNACETGFLECAKWLYKEAPNINISVSSEYPFRYACLNGHLNIAKWLLSVKPDINVIIWYNYGII